MSFLIAAPIVLPFIGAAACLALGGRRHRTHPVIAGTVAIALLGVAITLLLSVSSNGIQVLEVGGWPAPLGIVLVVDLFSAIMLCLTGIIGLSVVAFSLSSIDEERSSAGYYPLVLVLLGGVSGAFLTGDFFNLYVWFEVMLMASFVLLALGGGGLQLEGALKYVTLNILSSVFFLTTLGLLYSVAGTMNFADLSVRLQESPDTGLIPILSVLFLVSFGIKAALFPFFFWLPSSYHTPPVAISALFAGLLTKVGVYALIRVFTLLFAESSSLTLDIILIISGLTMVTGVLGAISQNEFRKILSVHIISQIGYMTMGLAFFTTLGIAGSIFYMAHNIIVKTNLFLISGLVYRLRGTFELKYLGGLNSHVLISLLFLVSALSLAGVPPLSGFFAKATLVKAGFENGNYIIVGVSLFVGLLTLVSMSKIWNEVFAKSPEAPLQREANSSPFEVAPVVLLAVLTIGMGLGAGLALDLSIRAAEQLLDPAQYVSAVLGESEQP